MKKKYILGIVILAIFVGIIWRWSLKNSKGTPPAPNSLISLSATPALSASEMFIQSVSEKAPPTNLKYAAEYWAGHEVSLEQLRSMGNDQGTSARIIRPCKEEGIMSKLECTTFIAIYTLKSEKKFTSINDFVQSDPDLKNYESSSNKKLVYRNRMSVPFVSTNTNMCFGTGGETCVKYEYYYLLQDGSVVEADLVYWPYDENQKPMPELSGERLKTLDLYKNILTQ